MDKQRILEREYKLEKEREAEPVMVMLKYQALEGSSHMIATAPMPREAFHMLLDLYSNWDSRVEMTHRQFKHYESLLDDGRMEKARRKLEGLEQLTQE